jgi:hypothetical protein
MSMVAKDQIVHAPPEQQTTNGVRSGALTRDAVLEIIEVTAQTLLGVSADEALARLDRGELEGTLAGGTLESLRWLLNS